MAGLDAKETGKKLSQPKFEFTELPKMVCTWLRDICSCSCLPVLPGPAWVLLCKIYKPFLGALYKLATPGAKSYS